MRLIQHTDRAACIEYVAKAHSGQLALAIGKLEALASAHRLTQESLDDLAKAIADMPSESRTTLLSFLSGVSSSVWAIPALVEYVKLLVTK